MKASEKADGYGRRYTMKPSKYGDDEDEDDVLNEDEEDDPVSFGDEDEEEEEESTSVASKRTNAVKQQVAESTSARQKRKTQFPNRFSVFAMTSMRQSVMVKKDKTLKKKLKEEPPPPPPEPEPEPEPKKKKKIIVVRQLKGLLGTLDDWASKSTTDVLSLLGISRDEASDYDLVFCNDDELDSASKIKLDSFTVKKGGASIAVMEECSSTDSGHGGFFNVGGKIGILGRFFKGDHEFTPPGGRMMDKNEKKRREEAMKKLPTYEVKKSKKKKKKDDYESDDDEDRPPVYDPYYHP